MLTKKCLAVFVCLSFPLFLFSADFIQEPVPIKVQRLSERAINLRVGDADEFGHIICNNVLAVSTKKGIVIIDTGYYPQSAVYLRELAAKEFGRSDFAYVINTHSHWDHINGNQAFEDVKIIAHENTVPAIQTLEKGLKYFINQRKERVRDWKNTLKDAEPGSELELMARGWSYAHQRFIDEFEQGFKIVYPAITFKEQLSLDLGDLKLESIYFPDFHSDNDILVYIPEEKILACGDLFYHNSLPAIKHSAVHNIPKWLEIMELLLADTNSVKTIIPGHGTLLSYQEVKDEWDYVSGVFRRVTKTREKGIPFEQTAEKLDFETHFSHLKLFPASSSNIAKHSMNIESIWNNTKKPAVTVFIDLLEEKDADTARVQFNNSYRNNENYYIRRDEFIDRGYDYFLFGEYEKAAAVLSLTADMFPDEWDVRDLLGDVFLKAREQEKAKKAYQKAVEINPDNSYVRDKLNRLSN